MSVAESKNLKLRAQQLSNPKERMGYLKQSIGMIEEALRIYPGRYIPPQDITNFGNVI